MEVRNRQQIAFRATLPDVKRAVRAELKTKAPLQAVENATNALLKSDKTIGAQAETLYNLRTIARGLSGKWNERTQQIVDSIIKVTSRKFDELPAGVGGEYIVMERQLGSLQIAPNPIALQKARLKRIAEETDAKRHAAGEQNIFLPY